MGFWNQGGSARLIAATTSPLSFKSEAEEGKMRLDAGCKRVRGELVGAAVLSPQGFSEFSMIERQAGFSIFFLN